MSNPPKMKPEICMLARSWTANINPTGWLMSEKLDGIRMVRPLGSREVLSREGNPFHPPAWWVEQLPRDIFLDGEAWIARGKFRLTQSILEKQHPVDDEWRQVTFRCIEPCAGLQIYPQPTPVFWPITHIVCEGRHHLQDFYERVLAAGGEGVVLRHPDQPYHTGRSPYLLRVKPEIKGVATVVGYNTSNQSDPTDPSDRLISLQCAFTPPKSAIRNPQSAIEFRLSNGLTEATRAHPPAIGSQIHFIYQCLSDAGKPMFARLSKPQEQNTT